NTKQHRALLHNFLGNRLVKLRENSNLESHTALPLTTCLSIVPNEPFRSQFLEDFKNVGSRSDIIRRGKPLWIKFMHDFFMEFFGRCFGFEVILRDAKNG